MNKYFERLKELLTTYPMIKSLVRHILTSVGGILVAKGLLTIDAFQEILGAIIASAGLFLSWTSSTKETNMERLQGIVRQLLMFLGGMGILKGSYFVGEDFYSLIGEVLTAISLIWSGADKMQVISREQKLATKSKKIVKGKK